ncbi:MAG: MerR family transcriptional regulator [Synergistaceae bacterium]|nr:MerR family transcriptional regulator [Synergistaceae bacterium]
MNYSIKEMSKMTGLAPSALRYYDKQGLLPTLKRDENNVRIFSDDDVRGLRVISCLKRSGLSIKDIKKFIDAVEQGDEALDKRLEIFTNRREILKQELEELQEISDMIEYKCWYYETACAAGTEDVMKNLKPSDVPEKFRKARERLLGQCSS